MACPTPKSIKNPKYYWKIHEYEDANLLVPCGNCPTCKNSQVLAWQHRLESESKHAKTLYFQTLTYGNWSIPFIDQNKEVKRLINIIPHEINREGLPTIAKSAYAWQIPNGVLTLHKPDIQKYLKRVKRATKIHTTQSPYWTNQDPCKYFMASEYGDNFGRPHYHIIWINLAPEIANRALTYWHDDNNIPLGDIDNQTVDHGAIRYVCSYIKDKDHPLSDRLGRQRVFSSMSKGIGMEYVNRAGKSAFLRADTYVNSNGYKSSMPKYYKNKIYGPTNYDIKDDQGNVIENRPNYIRDFISDKARTYGEQRRAQSLQQLAKDGYKDPEKELKSRELSKHRSKSKRNTF